MRALLCSWMHAGTGGGGLNCFELLYLLLVVRGQGLVLIPRLEFIGVGMCVSHGYGKRGVF